MHAFNLSWNRLLDDLIVDRISWRPFSWLAGCVSEKRFEHHNGAKNLWIHVTEIERLGICEYCSCPGTAGQSRKLRFVFIILDKWCYSLREVQFNFSVLRHVSTLFASFLGVGDSKWYEGNLATWLGIEKAVLGRASTNGGCTDVLERFVPIQLLNYCRVDVAIQQDCNKVLLDFSEHWKSTCRTDYGVIPSKQRYTVKSLRAMKVLRLGEPTVQYRKPSPTWGTRVGLARN